MAFNEKISIKQFQGIFYLIFGIIIFLITKYESTARAYLLVFLSLMFIVQGITILFEDSKKRFKILRAPNSGNYDSKGEREIAEYFEKRKIKFYVHPVVKVPTKIWIFDNPFKKRKLHPDFFLPEYDAYVEYWGMIENEKYKEKSFKRKKKAYLDNGIDFISLYPRNLKKLDWNFTQKLLSLIRDREGNNYWNK